PLDHYRNGTAVHKLLKDLGEDHGSTSLRFLVDAAMLSAYGAQLPPSKGCLRGLKGFVPRTDVVRVQVVAHLRDHLGGRMTRVIHQPAHLLRPVPHRFPRRDSDITPAAQRLDEHPYRTRSLADILMVGASRPALP